MKIGSVARQAGLSVDTVRYYERLGLLKPAARTAAGYRRYANDDVRRLKFISHAKELGFTLKEIAQLLALRTGGPDCDKVRRIALEKAADIDEKIKLLEQMRRALLELAGRCAQAGGDDCPIIHALEENDD